MIMILLLFHAASRAARTRCTHNNLLCSVLYGNILLMGLVLSKLLALTDASYSILLVVALLNALSYYGMAKALWAGRYWLPAEHSQLGRRLGWVVHYAELIVFGATVSWGV